MSRLNSSWPPEGARLQSLREIRAAESLAATREGLRRWAAHNCVSPIYAAQWALYVFTHPRVRAEKSDVVRFIRQAWRDQHSGYHGVPLRARAVDHDKPCA